MRLDVFLKLSRLVPRRSLAQEFCDAGLVHVNELVAKSSREIKVGDTIAINRRNRTTVVRVSSVPDKKQVSKNAASDLFTLVSDEQVGST
jgi:ribosomal 50S subunit-recycling heat shock protein